MRDRPSRVGAVAAESAAELIVDAALAHAQQRRFCHLARRTVAKSSVALQTEFQIARVRKFRRATEAAESGIEAFAQRSAQRIERRRVEIGAVRTATRHGSCERGTYLLVLLIDFATLFRPHGGDACAQIGKPRQAVARGLGEVRAAEERCAVGRQEHGQRPATRALREHLVGKLIDLVEIGALFAIDLDVDEQLVHHLGHGGVLKAFMRHHVAPVAGRIADREQDRFVLALRALEGIPSPGVPVDRVFGMLLQIGAGFACESVRHGKIVLLRGAGIRRARQVLR